VAIWFKNGRKGYPTIEDINPYVTAWKQWWIGLQPTWRKNGLGHELPAESEKWEKLYKGGTNGFILILITLGWWKLHSGRNREFKEMLEDTIWVCEQMVPEESRVRKKSRRG
jgi:hypothetical protein